MNQSCLKKTTYLSLALLLSTPSLNSIVDDITGDVGSAQSGSVILSGGTSGIVVDSTTSTITQKIDYISMPITSATNGQILIANEPCLHFYPSTNQNIFVGGSAGNFTNTGSLNTGCGNAALNVLTSGNSNTAVGHSSLVSITTGSENIALGDNSGSSITTGDTNILIGINAGTNYTSSESHNIVIGQSGGEPNETYTIRIGDGQTHTDCYIDGIYDASVDSMSGVAVYVDDTGKLGVTLSSAEFKTNISSIDSDSKAIWDLRPVSFVFKKDKNQRKQYGLIAEEVYKVFPDLVVLKHNKPHAVRYQELPVLLLNELQKKAKTIAKLQDTVQDLVKRIEKLEARIKN